MQRITSINEPRADTVADVGKAGCQAKHEKSPQDHGIVKVIRTYIV